MHKNCPICHYPKSHPFGLIINKHECTGCLTHKEKDFINWDDKLNDLKEIINNNKNKSGKYDCVVPVTGDAEDYYTLSKILALGLAPLVVCVNDYFKNDIGWYNLHQLITHFDVDSFIFNPDIRVYKELVRTSLRKHDHVLLPFIQLHTSFPVHVAFERKIPLIIWGQNQAVEQVGKFSHLDTVEMTRWNRRQHDLFDVEIDTLIGNGAQVDFRHLNYYHYPKIKNLSRRGVRGLYLSNYMRWDPLKQNSGMVEHGFQPETNSSSFDIYERAGSSVYYQIHDLLKLKRVGYRKISDHVARETRHGRITHEQGKGLIEKYSKSKVCIKPFFDWLGVSKSGYEWFKKHRLHGVTNLVTENNTSIEMNVPSKINSLLVSSKTKKDDFIIFGKGV
jgi:N-acetyl sugar amidotransferase